MCTYRISVDDALMARVRPVLGGDNAAVGAWMQSQIEMLLLQVAIRGEQPMRPPQRLSQRLRGIVHAPADFDYKQELANRY